MNYQRLYYRLFNGITDAIEAISQQNYGIAKEILISAQCDTEDMYVKVEETEIQESGDKASQNDER